MATTKASAKKKSPAKKTTSSAPKTAAVKGVAVEKGSVKAKKSLIKEFFARKYDANENILTIFKTPKIYGAILGEILGTALLSMLLLTLGYNPIYVIFGVLVVTLAVFAFSGANLNPAITVGMMASRRMSPIRGTLYIIAQVIGAWVGFMIISAFHSAGGGSTGAKMVSITAADDSFFWAITMIEFLCAIILGFVFTRALAYKKSVFTFAAIISAGVFLISIIALILTNDYLGIQNAVALNPAIAIVYQVLPSEGATFGELLLGMGKALTTFAVFPMIGATLGFYISDIAAKLSGEKAE